MRTGTLSLCVVGFVLSFGVSAQENLPELLIPVDPGIHSRFAERSNFDLREALYFAKRYRIVQIDFELLDKADAKFTITAFPQAAVTVQTTNIATPATFGANREWQGTLLEPRIHPQAVSDDVDSRQLEDLVNRIILWVSDEARDVPPALKRELDAEHSRQPLISNAPQGAQAHASGAAVMKIRTPTLSGKWFAPALQTNIRVMPVPEDPRYHVVYEEDRNKIPQGKDFEARRRAHKAFHETLDDERKRFEATGSAR
jgi:hypothetical protein